MGRAAGVSSTSVVGGPQHRNINGTTAEPQPSAGKNSASIAPVGRSRNHGMNSAPVTAKQASANKVKPKRRREEKREAEAQQHGKTSEPNY